MNIPAHIWCIVDKTGSAVSCESYEIAAAKALLWDLQFPTLAPHVTVCYSVCVPIPKLADTGTPDAIPDATFTSQAP